MSRKATLTLAIGREQVGAATKALDEMGIHGEVAGKKVKDSMSATERQILKTADAMKRMQEITRANAMASMISASDPFQKQTKSLTDAAEAAGKHHLAIGRVNMALEGLASEALGANSRLGSLASKFLEFGIGGIATAGALAGLALLALAWEKITEGARKAHEESKKATEYLMGLGHDQKYGKYGNTPEAIVTAGTELNAVRERIRAISASRALLRDAVKAEDESAESFLDRQISVAQSRSGIDLQLADLRHQEEEKLRIIQYGVNEQLRIKHEGEEEARRKAKERGEEELRDYEKRLKSLVDIDKANAARRSLPDHAAAMLGADSVSIAKREQDYARRNARVFKLAPLSDEFEQQAREIKQKQEDLLKSMRATTASFFKDFLDHGVSAFGRLFDSLKSMFTQTLADMAAKKLVSSSLGVAMSGFIGTAPTATTPGTGANGSLIGGLSAAMAAHPAIALSTMLAGMAIGFLALRKSGSEVREEHERLTDTYKSNIATVRTMLGQAAPLEKQLVDLRLQFADLRKEAVGLLNATAGSKAIEAYGDRLRELTFLESARADQLRQQVAEEQRFYAQDLQARLLAAQGHQDEADTLAFATQQQREYAQAVKDGKTQLELANLAEVQRAETIARSIAKLQTQITAYAATIDGLKSFKDALLLSDTAGLSPTAKLAEAQRQYTEVLKAAQGGDQGAAGRLPAAAQAFLDNARAVYGSTGQFQTILDQVLSDTDATIKYYDDARSVAQQQLEELKKILDAINLQTDAVAPGKRPTGDVNDDHHRGTGDEPSTGGGASGGASAAVVSAAGFTALLAKVDELRADVQANTRVTKNGLEAIA